jgi:excisionase family DNA binding protein
MTTAQPLTTTGTGTGTDRPTLCTDEAAALLGISKWLLLQEIKRGNIPHKRVGRRIVLSRQRLLDWLQEDIT